MNPLVRLVSVFLIGWAFPGRADDTEALRALFRGLPESGGQVTIPPGDYHLEGVTPVQLPSHCTVVSYGARFHFPDRLGDRPHRVLFSAENLSDFRWFGGHFSGHVFDPERPENLWEPNANTRAILIRTAPGGVTENLTFRDVSSDNLAGAAITVLGAEKPGSDREVSTFARNVTLENCCLERTGKFMWDYGYLWQITVWPEGYSGAERALAARYFRNDLVRGPVRMEGDRVLFESPAPLPVSAAEPPAVPERATDTVCFFGGPLPSNVQRGRQYFVVGSGPGFIRVSETRGGVPLVFSGGAGSGVRLIHNLFQAHLALYAPTGSGPGKGAMDLVGCNGVSVRGCRMSALGDTMHIQKSRNIVFAGNQITGSRMGAFFLAEFCRNAVVTGNTVDGTNGSRVISVEKSCEDVVITGNTFRNGGRGSWINQPRNFILADNVFVSNTTKCDPDPVRGRRSFVTGGYERYAELYFTTHEPGGRYGPVVVRGNTFQSGDHASDALTFAPGGDSVLVCDNLFQGRVRTLPVPAGCTGVEVRNNTGLLQDSGTNSVGMRLVPIRPGSFVMGQDGPPVSGTGQMAKHPLEAGCADWDEKPAHRVTITRPFRIGATEVTLGQYRQFDPGFRRGKGAEDEAVEGVSWNQAMAFCEWLSVREGKPYRLPTEAEWEYACRAGTATLFHSGDTLPDGHQKWFGRLGWRDLYFPGNNLPPEYRQMDGPPEFRVARTAPNAWGIYDMHGNVAEWCFDWHGPYAPGDQADPMGRADGGFRVFRGGRHSEMTRMLRSANRGGWIPESPFPGVGFRVVQAEPPRGALLPVPASPGNARNVSQQTVTVALQDSAVPFFAGPKLYRQVPEGQVGPLFTRHNHSPGLVECPNGDLLATWFSCVSEPGPELCNAASRLRLGAGEWEAPSPFWDAPDVNDHAPKLWWDGDQTLFHLVFEHEACNVVRTSTDNGATWSRARPLPMGGELGNSVVRTREGVLAISLDGASLVVSRDRGQTWTQTGQRRGKDDPRPGGSGAFIPGIHAALVQLADGRLMAMSRFDDVEDQKRFGYKMPVSYSGDLGESWQYAASEFPVVSSTQRPVLLRLREGPILLCSFTDQARDLKKDVPGRGLLFKSARGAYTGVGLFAAVSYDEGQTWPDRRLITAGASTKADTNGYLAVIQTRDGRIQLLTSSRHYAFNLPWIQSLPPHPQP